MEQNDTHTPTLFFFFFLMELSSQSPAAPATATRVDEEALSQLISLGGLIIVAYKFSVCDIMHAPTTNVRVCLA